MKNLDHLTFKALNHKKEAVKGKLRQIDFSNKVGISMKDIIIEDVDGVSHLVDADSVELVLKPHPDFDFENEDKVFVNNTDGTTDYFLLIYEAETASWVLIPFEDKHFKDPKKNKEGRVVAEDLMSFGYDLLERVEDYEFDSLD